jgi:hypothetical protein
MADVLILMLVEIIAQRSALPELRQIVIKGFLRNANLFSSVLKTHSDKLMILVHVAVVQLSPLRHLFNDVLNRAFLGSLGSLVDLSVGSSGGRRSLLTATSDMNGAAFFITNSCL